MAWAGRVSGGVWNGWEIVVDGGRRHGQGGAGDGEICAWIDFQDPPEGIEPREETDMFVLTWEDLDGVVGDLEVGWYGPVESARIVRQMYRP